VARKKIKVSTEHVDDVEFFDKQVNKIDGVKTFNLEQLDNPRPNSTGSINLDYDLHIPVPEGRYVEIAGDEGSGKTTLALEIVAQAVKNGKMCQYIDMERTLSRTLTDTIRGLGGHVKEAIGKVKMTYALSGEAALNAARLFASQFPNGLIVIDSVDALVPEAVLSEEIGKANVGNHARLMSEAMRKLVAITHENKVSLVFINQIREKVGVMFGDPRVTTGGRALKFYSSQRISLSKPSKKELMKDEDGNIEGHIIRYHIVKNKMAPQGKHGEFPLLYGHGIFRELELVEMCMRFGLIDCGGKDDKCAVLPIEDGKTATMSKRKAAGRLLEIDQELASELKEKLYNLINQ
jgi:recombination protein RecA